MIYFERWCIFLLSVVGSALAFSDDVYRIPKLFHLDDYDRCLSQKDGLYCLGTFQVYSTTENNTVYSIIKESSKNQFYFNRQLLHRGYCLSSRCPSKEHNATEQFKDCINKQLRKYDLKARLKKLSYCINHAEVKANENKLPDLPQRIFVYVISFILFMNVLGTLHDVYGKGRKNNFLLAWSFPANWKQLTTVNERASSAMFAHIQSSKILLHLIVMFSHSNLLHYMVYIYNTEDLEKNAYSLMNTTLRNGTSLVQVFVMLSSFVTAYGLLTTPRKPTTLTIAIWTFKRVIRIAPVYILVIGYAATWWAQAGTGPLWAPTVGAESALCRKKFWTHVLFINNFVHASEICLVQSWAMAVEIQLFLVSVLVSVLLMKLRVRAIPVLVMMFTASCVFNVILVYVADLVPMVMIIVPEKMRVLFRDSRSYFHLHMSPWSNLPACLFAILTAHIYFDQQNKIKVKKQENSVNIEREETDENNSQVNENKRQVDENKKENEIRNRKTREVVETYGNDKMTGLNGTEEKVKENKSTQFDDQNRPLEGSTKRRENKIPFLLRYAHCFTFPCLWVWVMVGSHINEVDSKAVVALYVGMERLMFCLMFSWQCLQMLTIQGPWGRLLSWRGWAVPARLSFSVVMVHWCVAASIAASRPQPVFSSTFSVSMDWLATLFYSYLIALPLSLFVELPMKKSLDVLIS